MKALSNLPADEARRRLPAVNLITDEYLQAEVLRVAGKAPKYFWEVPASSPTTLNQVCSGEHGLWAHTLMVSTVVEELGGYYERRFDVNLDYARAAAVLHDMRERGDPDAPSKSVVIDHDVRMERYIRDQTSLPDAIAHAVGRHMGAKYEGPGPIGALDELVHQADKIASTANAIYKIPGPVPEELEEIGVEEAEF
ncbi:HD domain-containing protein [Haloarcula sp. Atlit-7R]|uniref:HD domain-containing protein n=1 Tax=Haloarcula sp. Atlit-7R TaxID=2282125 RepID=UPI001314B4A5|nr:HD domain-containing protein [Haloarcula sp. Atlit-7R]